MPAAYLGSCSERKVTLHRPIEFIHRLLVPSVPDSFQVPCECLGEGEADVPESDDADGHVFDLFPGRV